MHTFSKWMKQFCLLSLFLSLCSMAEAATAASSGYKVIGYFPNWGMYRNPSIYPHDIDANLVTHINYAFTKVDTAGNIHLFDPWADTDYRQDWNSQKPYWGHFRELYDLKQKHPHLKTLISIGGWTLSELSLNWLIILKHAKTLLRTQCASVSNTILMGSISIGNILDLLNTLAAHKIR